MKLDIKRARICWDPTISDLNTGDTFHYESWYYMKIRISCANMPETFRSGGGRGFPYDIESYCAAVNLASGTVRLLDRDTTVVPVNCVAVITPDKGSL